MTLARTHPKAADSRTLTTSQVEDLTPFYEKNDLYDVDQTRRGGLEPPTSGFGDLRSTN